MVTDNENSYLGMLSIRKSKPELIDDYAKKQYKDLIDYKVPFVTPDNTIADALNIILKFDVDKVAVVDSGQTLGYLRSKDIFKTYLSLVKK